MKRDLSSRRRKPTQPATPRARDSQPDVPGLVHVYIQQYRLDPVLSELLVQAYRHQTRDALMTVLGIPETQLVEVERRFLAQAGRSVWVAVKESREAVETTP